MYPSPKSHSGQVLGRTQSLGRSHRVHTPHLSHQVTFPSDLPNLTPYQRRPPLDADLVLLHRPPPLGPRLLPSVGPLGSVRFCPGESPSELQMSSEILDPRDPRRNQRVVTYLSLSRTKRVPGNKGTTQSRRPVHHPVDTTFVDSPGPTPTPIVNLVLEGRGVGWTQGRTSILRPLGPSPPRLR